MESAAISREITQLESELSGLKARVDEGSSSFSALEQQLAELKAQLSETQGAVQTHEAKLAEKRAELEKARHLERLAAYEADVNRYRETRKRVGNAADRFLAELEEYDGEAVRLRKLRDEMRDAFGDDERVSEIDALLDDEAELTSAWKAVVGAAEWRVRRAEAKAPAAPKDAAPSNGEDLADDLKQRTEEGRASRILDYFAKN